MDIHIRQLRYFMELAKCLNFTRAAANLYIAQPVLSQQIAEMEKQLGVTLFTRSSRSVSLTQAGQILMNNCEHIMDKLNYVHDQMLHAQAGLRGVLRVGFVNSMRFILPGILRAFCADYPDIKINLINSPHKSVIKNTADGRLDVGFTLINAFDMSKEKTLTSQVLFRDDLCLAVNSRHPFVQSGCEDYSMLQDDALFCLTEEAALFYALIIHHICKELEIQFTNIVEADSLESILLQISAGLGISMLPGTIANGMPCKDVVFIPIKKNYLNYGIIWDEQISNPVLPLFLEALESEAGTDVENDAEQ